MISLDGFGMRAGGSGRGAGQVREVARRARDPHDFAPYASFDAVADRLQKNSRALARDRRRSSRGTGPRRCRTAASGSSSDPRHKLPFPTVYRLEETYAVWRNIKAPTLWIAAADSHIPTWLDDHPEGEGATDTLAAVRKRRFTHIPRPAGDDPRRGPHAAPRSAGGGGRARWKRSHGVSADH